MMEHAIPRAYVGHLLAQRGQCPREHLWALFTLLNNWPLNGVGISSGHMWVRAHDAKSIFAVPDSSLVSSSPQFQPFGGPRMIVFLIT